MSNLKHEDDPLHYNYYTFSKEFSGNENMEYQEYLNIIRQTSENISYGKVQNIRGNIFDAFPEYSLATSVSADFEMSVGLIRRFKIAFNNVSRLKAERVYTGGVAFLNYDNHFVYYLVIKPVFYAFPTYYSVWLTLQALKEHAVANNVKKIAITQIACGIDNKLRWYLVKQMMEFIFRDVDIHIKAFDMSIPINCNENYD